MKKRFLLYVFLMSVSFMILLPCSTAKAEEDTMYDIESQSWAVNGSWIREYIDPLSPPSGPYLTIESEASDIIELHFYEPYDISDMSGSGFGIICYGPGRVGGANGPIKIRLYDNRLFTLKKFSYVVTSDPEDTITIRSSKGSETIIVPSEGSYIFTPANPEDFTLIDYVEIERTNHTVPIILDNILLTLFYEVQITASPVNGNVNQGGNVSFSVSTSGDVESCQWQVETEDGSGFEDISDGGVYNGVATASLQITGATESMNNYKYRAYITGVLGDIIISNPATLTVNTPPNIISQPDNVTVDQGSHTSFSVIVAGTSLSYQWQVNTGSGYENVVDGLDYFEATTDTLEISSAAGAMDGYQYRVIVTGAGGLTATSIGATLTVISPASISSQPVDAAVREGYSAEFSVTAAGTDLTYQWQVDTGSGFTNITDNLVYSGAESGTLHISEVTFSMNDNRYRVVINGIIGVEVISDEAILTVNKTYQIIYQGNYNNGGTVPADTTKYLPGESVLVRGNSGMLTKAGYIFKCWNTVADGTGSDYQPNDEITVVSADIILYAKWDVLPDIPSGQQYSQTQMPTLKGEDQISGWDEIIENIADTDDDNFIIDMGGTDAVPVAVLNTIRGRDTDIVLSFGDGIEWIINGMDIDEPDPSDINNQNGDLSSVNLKVTLNTNSIPEDIISELSSGDSLQLSLAYEGNFGFTARLRLKVNDENRGRLANLFYYNPETNQLEFQFVSRVDSKGNIILAFTHASDYIIVFDDHVLLEDDMSKVAIDTLEKTLYVGGNKDTNTQLKVIIPDNIYDTIKLGYVDYDVTYRSSNTKDATVAKNGKVFAKSAGEVIITTTITIGDYQKSFTSKITVNKAYIELVHSTKTMKKGKTFTFTAFGYGVDTSKIKWKTTKKSVVVIEKKTGKAIAKSSGSDYVVAYTGDITKKIKVVVKK